MQNKTILLIEDNPDEVHLTLRALKHNQIHNEVIVRNDGETALAYLARTTTLPTVILLDINLPGMDGVEVLRRIRSEQRWKALPVVILTSSKEEQDLLKTYHNGANSFIRKPVDFDQFTEVVRQLAVYWLRLNEPLPGGSVC